MHQLRTTLTGAGAGGGVLVGAGVLGGVELGVVEDEVLVSEVEGL